jgi:hypothetical protein
MKKWLLIAAVGLATAVAGCDMDIPNDEVGSLTQEDYCGLTGGTFKPSSTDATTMACYCGNTECQSGIACRIDQETGGLKCARDFNQKDRPHFLPKGECTSEGIIICNDYLSNDGKSVTDIGYFTECKKNSNGKNVWSEPQTCASLFSCMSYGMPFLSHASRCGECSNGASKCESNIGYICSEGIWVKSGNACSK